MPIDWSGQCISFTEMQIDAMGIETLGIRDGSHPTETAESGVNTMEREWLCDWEQRYNTHR